MAPPLVRGRALVRQRLFGLVFLAVLAGLVGLTIAQYNKAFTPVVRVALEADRAGSQLSKGADVKARGVLVGEVREVEATDDGARLELALDPDEAAQLPSDVRARMLPKTLFGEKYVSLVVDDASTAPPLEEGDVIPQDRSQTARETAQAIDNLLPLLRTLQPDTVSTTLNALSSALRGRGDRIGENAALVRDWLAEINPELPVLEDNFDGLADFADTVDAATPDIVAVLDDLAFSSRSLVETRDALDTFLAQTAGLSGRTESFLRENEQRFVRLAADSLPTLDLFQRYSPGFPCMLDALLEAEPEVERAAGGDQPGVHITLEIIHGNGPYVPGDEPEYLDDGGPTCRGLTEREVPFPVYRDAQDGYRDSQAVDPWTGQSQGPAPSASDGEDDTYGDGRRTNARAMAFSPASYDRAAIGAVVGPVLGVAPSDVPDSAVLLFGPVARGTQASVS